MGISVNAEYQVSSLWVHPMYLPTLLAMFPQIFFGVSVRRYIHICKNFEKYICMHIAQAKIK